MLREVPELRVKLIVKQSGFVRMNADCCVDEWMFFGKPKSRGVRIIRDITIAYADYDLDSGIESALNDSVPVCIEVAHLDVRV